MVNAEPSGKRVAVLGSGLAGLTVAHLLSLAELEGRYDVHIYDQSPHIGLDAATITLDDGTRVETPMRAVQGGYYRRLLRMYAHLGVKSRTIDFDYCLHRAGEAMLIYNGANGLRSDPVSRPTTQSLPVFLILIPVIALTYLVVTFRAILHWGMGHYADLDHPLHRTTLRDWCKRGWVPRVFCDLILLPLFACVCTAPLEDVERTPAADVLEYIATTFGRRHYLTDMSAVSRSLLHRVPASNLHLGQAIVSLGPDPAGGLSIHLADGTTATYDHVISCLPPPSTARLSYTLAKSLDASSALSAVVAAERRRAVLLARFPTRTAVVVNHSDVESVRLPLDQRDRRILNLDIPSEGFGHVAATHIVHPASPTRVQPILQTTNPSPTTVINPKRVLSETTFERAVVTIDSRAALKELWSAGGCQGARGFWVAGSWCAEGIPLLEGCVVSAERVVQGLWRTCDIPGEVPW